MRETCQLALRSLEEKTNVKAPSCEHSQTNFYLYRTDVQFQTVDPVAKNNRHIKSLTVKELGAILINEEEDLYDRYEALFQLRDLNDENASEYIVRAMQDKCSALLRHEVSSNDPPSQRFSRCCFVGGVRLGTNSNTIICQCVG